MHTPTYKALRELICSEEGGIDGKDVTVTMFLDPRRDDVYVYGSNLRLRLRMGGVDVLLQRQPAYPTDASLAMG
jgi:hypothetical protein